MTRKMRDSGVEWIGEIPEAWSIIKLKKISMLKTGTTPSTKDNDLFEGDFDWFTPADFYNGLILTNSKRKVNSKYAKENIIPIYPSNSVLIIGIGATIGKVGLIIKEASSNQQLTAIIPKRDIKGKYLLYVMSSGIDMIKDTALYTTLPILNNQTLGNFIIPKVELIEQEKIVNYLDNKCNKIDQTIEKEKQVIEKLKEYKQSVITEAVTKGLNPDVKMKDSGVEWIGCMPEHWGIKCIKHICSKEKYSIVDGPFGSDMKNEEYVDNGIPIIQLNNIGIGEHKLNNLKFITEKKAEDLKRHTIYSGEIVIAKMMPAGRATIVSNEYARYILASDSIRLKLDDNNVYKFIEYCLNVYGRKEAEIQSSGTTRSRINLGIVKNIHLALPNVDEQQQIADYLDKKCSSIDKLISEKEELIQKLTEYKKSLIYECVTGKREV